ncbi:MAG: hypothetical protein J5J00_16850 [Deltaproteobacteria bacterium]|nr:hypothetical protein [Deltaproteobacteria bacterium]
MIRAIFIVVGAALAIVPQQASADKLAIKQQSWISTGRGNSLESDPDLFTFANGAVTTQSESTNIHTHYSKKSLTRLKNYVFSGEMYIADEDGGIGVTFHSDYPNSDTYYRLRRFGGDGNFHIAPHPDGEQKMTSGNTDMGLGPQAERWYGFKVMVRTTRKATRVRARAWRSDVKEPKVWLIDCSDSSSIHIKRGRLGLWSAGPGLKSWRKLKVVVQ